MNPVFDTFTPDGFGNVNPYLFVPNPKALISFLKEAFYAEELSMTLDEKSGVIRNCILKIGDSCLMISQASGQFEGMKTSLYLYVEEVDRMHQRALDKGAEEVIPPENMDYGDRQSGIIDPSGNYWWISQRLEKKSYED